MARKVQTYPQALIELLQIKGQEPFFLDDQFKGTLDVTQILAAQDYQIAEESDPAVAGNGEANEYVVPVGQTHIVHGVQVTGFLPAVGDNLAVGIGLRPNTGGLIRLSQDSEKTATLAGQFVRALYLPNRLLVLNAGTRITSRVADFSIAGGSTTVSLTYWHSAFGSGSTS